MKKHKCIFEAIGENNIESVKYRLEYTNLNIRDNYGETILSKLIKSNIWEIAEMLIDEGVVDINLRNIRYNIATKQETFTYTPLMIACYKGNYKIAKKLIDKKANLDIQDEFKGWTALMLAIESTNVEIVKSLIEAGANINIKNYNNETAIDNIKKRLETAKNIVEIDNLLTNYTSINN